MNKELILEDLEMVLEKLESGVNKGICIIANSIGTMKYISNNRPTILSKFWWTWSYNILGGYFWPRNEVGRQQRILFVRYLIQKLKDESTTN